MPAGVAGNQTCAALMSPGNWSTDVCTALYKPICEAPFAISRAGEILSKQDPSLVLIQ